VATASSAAPNQDASKAIDGVINGYSTGTGGDSTKEWATAGEGVGAALTLTFPSPIYVQTVVLYDRINLADQVLAGTLTFDDGSTQAVPMLNNAGGATAVQCGNVTTTNIVFTVNRVSTTTANIGLAEIQVFGSLALVLSNFVDR
jgi:hypothetical protein